MLLMIGTLTRGSMGLRHCRLGSRITSDTYARILRRRWQRRCSLVNERHRGNLRCLSELGVNSTRKHVETAEARGLT